MAKSSSARVARRVANKSETSVPSTADVKALTGSDAGNAMKGRNFTVAPPIKPEEISGTPKIGSNNPPEPINYTATAKSEDELKANLEAAFTTIGRAGFDLETNGTVKLALCAADFAVLVNSGSIKLDDKGQTRFDYTKEDLVKVVTNKFRSYIKPWVSGEGDNSIEKKRYGLENMRSVATMLPNAIKKGVLVLLGDAEIAYTKPAKRLTLDMDVIPASDLPEGDAGKEYVRCVACKYSAVRPSITNKDSKTGKIEKRKNGDASLVVVTDEMASVLYSLHFGKSGTKAVEDKETGWYVMPARVTQPAAPGSGQGQRSDLQQGDNPALISFKPDDLANSLVAKLNAKKEKTDKDGKPVTTKTKGPDGKEVETIVYTDQFKFALTEAMVKGACKAVQTMAERLEAVYPDKKPHIFVAPMAELFLTLSRVVNYDSDGNWFYWDSNGKQHMSRPDATEGKDKPSDALGEALAAMSPAEKTSPAKEPAKKTA